METIETVLLWLLGVISLLAGAMKAFMPAERLTSQPNMEWIERTGIGQARIAGWSEVLAGLAFIGTALGVAFLADTDVFAILAAIGLVVVMALAAVRVHLPADEPIVPNIVLGALAALLAVLLLI